MALTLGGRDATKRISVADSSVAVLTANVTILPPISLRGSLSSGDPTPPFFAAFLASRYPFPFGKWRWPFCNGEAGESIRKSGTGLEDPF